MNTNRDPGLPFNSDRLARSSDPATSKAAAGSAKKMRGAHFSLILTALEDGPGSAEEVSVRTGGTVDRVQVAKRWKELEDAGLVRRLEETARNRNGRQAHRYELTEGGRER